MCREQPVRTYDGKSDAFNSEKQKEWIKEGNEMLQNYTKDKEWVSGRELAEIFLHHVFGVEDEVEFTLE